MKKLLAAAFFGFAMAFNSFSAPASAEQLRSEFEAALKAKDANAALVLINWQGVPDDIKKIIQTEVSSMCQREVTNVSIIPINHPLEFEGGGFHYKPNVSVVGAIRIQFGPVKDTNTFAAAETEVNYGKKDDAFYIAGSTKEKVTEPTTKQKIFIMNIDTLNMESNVFSGSCTGSCVYVSFGTPVTYNFGGNGNCSALVNGDYIKSCTVKNSSGNGTISLVISEDGKEIFNLRTNAPITYEGKQ
jgi:hypothetical protein